MVKAAAQAQALDEGLVFWCALCHMDKPLQSTKAMEAHRGYTAGSKPVGKKRRRGLGRAEGEGLAGRGIF